MWFDKRKNIIYFLKFNITFIFKITFKNIFKDLNKNSKDNKPKKLKEKLGGMGSILSFLEDKNNFKKSFRYS